MRKSILLILGLLLIPSTVFADATSARQEIEAVHAYIQGNEIFSPDRPMEKIGSYLGGGTLHHSDHLQDGRSGLICGI
jgi:hypothetical protein